MLHGRRLSTLIQQTIFLLFFHSSISSPSPKGKRIIVAARGAQIVSDRGPTISCRIPRDCLFNALHVNLCLVSNLFSSKNSSPPSAPT
ncbi:hypothetical protein BJX62DRAFT_69244 [Aspergillus germanicus]